MDQDLINRRKRALEKIRASERLKRVSREFLLESSKIDYGYLFNFLGIPIIQQPQDILAIQEIIWTTKPDLIIETGIAHGGSLICSATMLAVLDMCDAATEGVVVDPRKPKRKVLGIDIDIRSHNRRLIQEHPLSTRIELIQGSSVSENVIEQVKHFAAGFERIMICLDSNHTHKHVLAELEAYAELTSKGCYCVIFDTNIAEIPDEFSRDRPWGVDNNPKTAVNAYLESHFGFEVDKDVEDRLLITSSPDGFLKRIN